MYLIAFGVCYSTEDAAVYKKIAKWQSKKIVAYQQSNRYQKATL